MSLTVNLSAFGTIWGLLGALFIGGMMYMAAQANMQRFLHLLQLKCKEIAIVGQ